MMVLPFTKTGALVICESALKTVCTGSLRVNITMRSLQRFGSFERGKVHNSNAPGGRDPRVMVLPSYLGFKITHSICMGFRLAEGAEYPCKGQPLCCHNIIPFWVPVWCENRDPATTPRTTLLAAKQLNYPIHHNMYDERFIIFVEIEETRMKSG
jgi:hypothetical protein